MNLMRLALHLQLALHAAGLAFARVHMIIAGIDLER
jgi:hypothetical protein